jgi:hypothetical protein
MNLDYLRRFAVNQSLFAPPVALASRADRKFTFLPLQAGSDDVVPKSASWKARFWIEQLRRVWHSPSCRSSCSASADRPCATSGGIPQMRFSATLLAEHLPTHPKTCLLRADILRGPDQRPHPRKHRVRGPLLGQCLGHSKIDNLRAPPCHLLP